MMKGHLEHKGSTLQKEPLDPHNLFGNLFCCLLRIQPQVFTSRYSAPVAAFGLVDKSAVPVHLKVGRSAN